MRQPDEPDTPNPWYDQHPALADEFAHARISRMRETAWRRSLLLQCALFLLALALWWVPVINPIKLLVVLFHEISHVAAAYATGGVVFGIAIDPGGAGVTLGIGGNKLVIMAMGYVGSILCGVILYVLMGFWDPDEVWLILCAFVGLSLTFGWLNDFTAVFGYGTMLLILVGVKLSEDLKKIFLRWVATTCCLYPMIDVILEAVGDKTAGFMVRQKYVGSDVSQLAQLMGLPLGVVAGFCIAGGLAVFVTMVVWSANRDGHQVEKIGLRNLRRGKQPASAIPDPLNPVRYRIR